MAAASTDFFTEVGNPGTATTLAAPGHTIGGSTFNVVSTSNYPTNTGVVFAVDTFTIQTVNGVATAVRTPGSYTEWEGTVTNSTTLSNAVLRYGTDQNYAAGSNTRINIPVASSRENRLVQGIQLFANQDGSLKTAPVLAAIGAGQLNGYTPLGQVPTSVTYNGNRSYTMVLPTDLTGIVSNGMRLRTTRTVAAPTQCTSLNGTSQYYSKTTPSGMTFTDNFTLSAWVKLTSYQAGMIISRYNSTGFYMSISAAGQIIIAGTGAASRQAQTYQSLPLNKWVHVAATLSMSSGTSLTYIDGISVPNTVTGTGTSLTQAGNLEVGSVQGGTQLLAGKIAQAAVFSAVLSQATIQSYISQGILGTETSLISAYSFNNSINDLNTTNANNLTANGGAVATNADSPFTQDDRGAPSGTNDFAIVTSRVFSTNTTLTVQVPEGCTIPTSGGVSAIVYSSNKVPFGFPSNTRFWIFSKYKAAINANNTVFSQYAGRQIIAPVGEWELDLQVQSVTVGNASGANIQYGLSTVTTGFSDDDMVTTNFNEAGSVIGQNHHHLTKPINMSAQTVWYGVNVNNVSSTTFNDSGTPPQTITLKLANI